MQRRYHMPGRFPIMFWLLLAATISVDAVVLSQVAGERYLFTGYLSTIWSALVVSQLSVVCLWSALKTAPTTWSRAAPFGAVAVAALAAVRFQTPLDFPAWAVYWSFFGYFFLHAVVLLALMWLLQRTNSWQRRTGVKRTWQFSLAHLLIVMTLTGVLAAVTRQNLFFADDGVINVTEPFCCVVLAIASALLWSASWNWLLRFASVISVAALLGVATQIILFGPAMLLTIEVSIILQGYYLIQAIVLSIWLGAGPMLPQADDSLPVANETSPAQS